MPPHIINPEPFAVLGRPHDSKLFGLTWILWILHEKQPKPPPPAALVRARGKIHVPNIASHIITPFYGNDLSINFQLFWFQIE
jgi:hypothetical protein